MTDRELYVLCKRYGADCLGAKRRFLLLLPEVEKRKIYRQRGFCSIYEFAARLCGVNREQVNEIFRLDEKLRDFPILYKALYKGEISISKFTRIISILCFENQEELLNVISKLSKSAIEQFVRDYKNKTVAARLEIADNLFVFSRNVESGVDGNGCGDANGSDRGAGGGGGRGDGTDGKNCENVDGGCASGCGRNGEYGRDLGAGLLNEINEKLKADGSAGNEGLSLENSTNKPFIDLGVKNINENGLLMSLEVLPGKELDYKEDSGSTKMTDLSDTTVPNNSQFRSCNVDFELVNALSGQIKQELFELHKKGININDLIGKFLLEYKQQLSREKEVLAEENESRESSRGVEKVDDELCDSEDNISTIDNISCNAGTQRNRQNESLFGLNKKVNSQNRNISKSQISRYIPVKIKRFLKTEYGNKCAIKNCLKMAQNIHHEKMFSKHHSHDPRFLKPLCREHHELVHLNNC